MALNSSMREFSDAPPLLLTLPEGFLIKSNGIMKHLSGKSLRDNLVFLSYSTFEAQQGFPWFTKLETRR